MATDTITRTKKHHTLIASDRVEGTAVPTYRWRWQATEQGGKPAIELEVRQEGVPAGFRMPVPLAVDFGGGRRGQLVVLVDEAAETFIREHPGEIGLITLSIGGNDVTACADAVDPVACVTSAVDGISTNVPEILQRLRAAAGPETVIVGTTYPDVILGQWLDGTPEAQQLAALSVTAFKQLINPALAKAYADAGGEFVDVTAATGAYGPMTELTALAPYGEIPVPVPT